MNNWERQEKQRLAQEPPDGVEVNCVGCGEPLNSWIEGFIHLRGDHQIASEDAHVLLREFPRRGRKAANELYENVVHGTVKRE